MSALIGLKQTLPHSLSHTFQRILSRTGASKPACVRAWLSRVTRGETVRSGSPSVNRLNSWCSMTPGATTSQAGSTTQPMARSGPISFHCRPPGSTDRRQRPSQRAAFLVEVPPGDAVHGGDDGGLGPEQRREAVGGLVRLMRLQRAQHVVLRAQLRRIVGGAHARSLLPPADAQRQPARADRGQVLAAGHHAHLVAGKGELDGEIAADRPGAEYADLHATRSPRRRTAT